jgi:exosortase A
MSAISADIPHASSAWRRSLVCLGVVIGALLLVFQETAVLMVGIWSRSDTFAHAFLVPPITLWLIWRERHALAALSPKPQPWVLPFVGLALLAWLLGHLAAVNAITQLALVTLLVLCVPAVLGMQVARAILFPLAFLFFCVPIGEFLLPVLMDATADFTVTAVQMSGVPVYREGLQFVIPSGRWSVVEACSGVRYLIASFMVGSLFGFLNYSSNRKRWIFIVVSLTVPLLANWLRAYMIVMIGHLSNNKLAVGVDHLIYGWVFFGVVIMAMFLIGARWADPDAGPMHVAASSPEGQAAASGGLTGAVAAVTAALLLMFLVPQAVLARLERSQAAATKPKLVLPDSLAGTAAVPPASDWKPTFAGAAVEAGRSYAAGAQTVGLYIAYYRAQTYQHKLVSSDNVLVMSNDPHWNRLNTVALDLHYQGELLRAQLSALAGAEHQGQAVRPMLTVMQLYWINGRLTSSDHWAKVLGVLGRLTGQGDDGAAIFFSVPIEPESGGKQVLGAFAEAHLNAVAELLQKTRAER